MLATAEHIELMDGSSVAAAMESPSLFRDKTMAPSDAGDLLLVYLLHVPYGPDSILFRLASVLTRIEDLSHVLLWCSPSPIVNSITVSTPEGEHSIQVIELPRLKVRFQPRRDLDGVVRLYLLDQAGWFVSDSVVSLEVESTKKAPECEEKNGVANNNATGEVLCEGGVCQLVGNDFSLNFETDASGVGAEIDAAKDEESDEDQGIPGLKFLKPLLRALPHRFSKFSMHLLLLADAATTW